MLARKIGATAATQFIVLFLGIFTSVLINRSLLPEGRGLLTTYVTAVQLISTIGSLGLAKGYTYSISHSKGNQSVVKSAVATAVLNALAIGLLSIPLTRIQLGGVFDQLPNAVLPLLILATIGSSLMAAGNEITRGLNLIREFNIGSLLYQSLYLVINLILGVFFGLNLTFVIVTLVVSQLITSLYYFKAVYKLAPGLSFKLSMMRQFLGFGLKYLVYTMLSAFHNRVDVFIIGSMMTSSDVGQYSVGVNLAQLLWNLPFAINIILFPYVAEREQDDNVSLQTARVTRVTTILLTSLSIPVAFLAPYIIQLLYGSSYLPAVEPLRYLLPGIIAFGIVRVAGAHVLGRNQLFAMTLITGVVMIINVLLNFQLIPIFGINGAAIASSITYTLNAIGVAWLISKEGYVKITDVLLPQVEDLHLMSRSSSKLLHWLSQYSLI